MPDQIFDPPISHFVIFSGGGGLIEREGQVTLAAGENQLQIKGVPASFDPETLLVQPKTDSVRLKELVVKKPSRQYVEDNLRREGAAARKLIEHSVEVGAKRAALIEICEEVAQRTYLDEEVDLNVWLVSPSAQSFVLKLSYFVDDARFKWKPTLSVELDKDNGEVRVRGLIAITNESAHRLTDVEVSFADFARDLSENEKNYRVPPEELRAALNKQVLRKMMLK
jgi:hypothetical protein